MPYTTAEARQQLLDTLAQAIDELGVALAALTEAYEALDENTADRLERDLFGPVQLAYGRARRTHAEFAERHGLPGRTFAGAVPPAPSRGARGLVEDAVRAVAQADVILGALQDSMLPVEVGDPPLRAGLEEVRSLLGAVAASARELVRVFGR